MYYTFLITGILGLIFPIVLGGGHELIMSLKEGQFTLLFLFILILGSAFLELVGVSAIMPLVNIIVDSTSI